MDLTSLSGEYQATTERLSARLQELRRTALTAEGEEAIALQRRAEQLGAELCDLRIITNHLRQYYKS